MKTFLLMFCLLFAIGGVAQDTAYTNGLASWCGEAHRGKLMANGKPFDPDELTAASWFYPLGTRARVSLLSQPERFVVVTITDHGPARRLVAEGRVIDLARAAFEQLACLDVGLVSVSVEPLPDKNENTIPSSDQPRLAKVGKSAETSSSPELVSARAMERPTLTSVITRDAGP